MQDHICKKLLFYMMYICETSKYWNDSNILKMIYTQWWNILFFNALYLFIT